MLRVIVSLISYLALFSLMFLSFSLILSLYLWLNHFSIGIQQVRRLKLLCIVITTVREYIHMSLFRRLFLS